MAESAHHGAGAGVDAVVDVHRRPQPRDRRGAQRRRRHEIGVAELPDAEREDGTDALFESLLVEEALAGSTWSIAR